MYLLSTGGAMEKVYSKQTGSVENKESKIDAWCAFACPKQKFSSRTS